MAGLQLTPILVPLVPQGLTPVTPPSNPPTAGDVQRAHAHYHTCLSDRKLGSHRVSDLHFADAVRYRTEIDGMYCLNQPPVAPVAPAPGLAPPMGLPQLFQVLTNIQTNIANLRTNMTDLQRDFRNHATESRRSFIVLRNSQKGSGTHAPYEMVPLPDGTDPTEATPVRAAMPALTTATVLLNLTDGVLDRYVRAYGLNVPNDRVKRLTALATCIGCTVMIPSQ
ncbi:hypothetical protein D9757_005844 [Collybiopsis confluens]|uniref:Mug135-like C-terminal domain-containing protein n=1 Tax=Collybiopsis confluens TaxID=2823264 RepID=A0A8H5HN67_9AGAR|nr:hypothetical protein D9757_005844 [Collybiopsis confluens]